MKLSQTLTLTVTTLLALMINGCQPGAGSAASNHQDHHDHPADAPAVHGMLVFGTNKIWLSHLPMFHKPHDYQVIMEVTLKKNGEDLQEFYLNDRTQSGATYYTFVPKKFSMTHLVAGHLTSIEGTLVRDHFERGGIPIAANVTAEITAIPVAEQFKAGAEKPATAIYYVIGDQNETWLAHKIVAKPDEFDQIIAGTIDNEFWATNVSGSVVATTLNNIPAGRLTPDSSTDAIAADGLNINVTAGPEIYVETGDLDL